MHVSTPTKTIAIVEDNADNRLLLRAFLQAHFNLSEYETGEAALEAWCTETPDAVLLDISLPDMDGSDVLIHLRQMASMATVPVIAFTAHAMLGDRERYLAQGFDAYITKPILDFNELIQTLHALT